MAKTVPQIADAIEGVNKELCLDADNDVFIATNKGVPDDGESGFGAGKYGPGSIVIDFVNGDIYVNQNTKASPLWYLATVSSA